MRERVVNEVLTREEETCQVQNLPLPGWAPELSTIIASATAEATAEAAVNAICPSGGQGNFRPFLCATDCWSDG